MSADMTDPANWPPSLHEFVSASFTKANNLHMSPPQKNVFQDQLKQLINLAISAGKVVQNDWSRQRVPILEGTAEPVSLQCNRKRKSEFSPPPSKKSDTMSSEERVRLRGQRFKRELSYVPTADEPVIDPNVPFVGTCTKLEKKYLRLTSQPIPDLVRPPKVLKKTLQLLMDKYLSGASYSYLCDQLKSVRQDLTVQSKRTEFTIRVYEFHCKLAMEFGDLGEFNQCQSQLKLLYEMPKLRHVHKNEYNAYRLLYCVITSDYSEANNLRLQVVGDASEYLVNAFAVHDAALMGDWYRLFSLARRLRAQNEADQASIDPNAKINVLEDGNALLFNHTPMYFFCKFLDLLLARERVSALATITAGFHRIPVDFLEQSLLLDKAGQFQDFCKQCKIAGYVHDDSYLDCHGCRGVVTALKNSARVIDIKGQI